MKTPRILGFLITSVLATGAFATGENTVTSKSYVDAMDATKQDIITAKTTGNVVTYNGTHNGQTVFDEVAIYNGSATYTSNDASKLITAGAVQGQINNFENNLTPVRVVKTVCSNPPACTLWEMRNTFVHELGSGWECVIDSDCTCGPGERPVCENNHQCGCGGK